ncbi:PASTA domain-containing protein [Desulforamulus hydrothermalis]|uniref:PASTA domain-containing protein n=1 Tax=Desulforamulus hydrothermalis Lam5 = DSM 18033 TaxID=1121428 RepID=K8E148_9FIRM|nr:PASTA domain-containing protein [Desulforamulus hydrothermalis]CCO09442.1 conserved hypothetical protein [Desulforamulus hydrothermalis Lam5 = DSM 18033]SHH08062.1 hypothetical protein SAMN02745177_01363 [Desulforamulus hydrothermalis Lam5 = DSM 18033]
MIPDVLGYRLDDALSLLQKQGCRTSVIMTGPPRRNPDGLKRVVKMQTQGDQVILTVACEEKGKGGIHHGI